MGDNIATNVREAGGGVDGGKGEFGAIEDMAVGEQLGASKPWVGTLNKFKERYDILKSQLAAELIGEYYYDKHSSL